MIDMHAHLSQVADEELKLRSDNGILTCFSSGTPKEWKLLCRYKDRDDILISFGIHPWYADLYTVEECREYFEQCDFVGEIGMDSVWCDVPLRVQQLQLEKQLQVAESLKKPVILHTKGQEGKIADMIRGFSQKVCVHWFSGTESDFEKFLDLGCYFTLGPDTADKNNSLIKKMVKEIPVDRLFLETDGVSAISWALEKECEDIIDIPGVLSSNIEYAAKMKNCTVDFLLKQMQDNLNAFLHARSALHFIKRLPLS